MKIKVAELEGAKLDYWVGVSYGLMVEVKNGACFRETSFGKHEYNPSTDWSQGGPIINRERISIGFHEFWGDGPSKPPTELYARAYMWKPEWKKEIKFYGPNALVNAMRCFVASKFGEEVEE